MILDLKKGSSISLIKKDNSSLTKFSLGVNWGQIETKSFFGSSKTAVDLDASVILYDENKKEIDTVWFRNLKSKCTAIRHSGDDLTGDDEADDKDNETITIDLQKINTKTKFVALTIHSFRGQEFSSIPYIDCNVYNNSEEKPSKLANFKVNTDSAFKGKFSMLIGICSKGSTTDSWSFSTTGAPLNDKTFEASVQTVKSFL